MLIPDASGCPPAIVIAVDLDSCVARVGIVVDRKDDLDMTIVVDVDDDRLFDERA